MKHKTPPELDRITDVVLAYKPKPKTKAAKRRQRKRLRDAKKDSMALVLAERERCARIAEEWNTPSANQYTAVEAAKVIAANIRRGDVPA